MKSRASLVLIEQVVMLMVFALAAALCLKAFVWADTESEALLSRDRALQQAQSAAEVIKSCRGDIDAAAEIMGGSVSDGGRAINCGGYVLTVTPIENDLRYMASAEVCVYENETPLASLSVAWQEVGENE